MFKEKNLENVQQQQLKPSPDGNIRFDLLGNKIHFISLGCPRNLVDSEVMLGILLKAGYEISQDPKCADYIVINTCGFLEASRQESMEMIEETLAEKKKDAKVIVAGCMVQTHKDTLKSTFPAISYFLGSGDVEGILKAVQAETQGEQVTFARSYLEAGEVPRQLSTPKHFAYLKIAEGCKKSCAYCVIPKIKGPLKSKTKEQILKEFSTLLSMGVKEVILIAQDLGDFGKDRGFKRVDGLIDLLKSLLAFKEPFWLRLLYLYPDEITKELITLMKSDSRICPYLDMPIQHIDDSMLKAMHRATNQEKILSTLSLLRKEIPSISIRTSLIVGFPGETEAQFLKLEKFLKEHPLDNVGIFKFSREIGSYAYDLPDQIPEEVKEKRRAKLMRVQQKALNKLNLRWIGQKIPVIIEGVHPDSPYLLRGRHQGQCPDIDGEVIINDGRKVKAFGEIYTVEITAVAGYDLVGKVIA